jgi:kinesin family protein 11
LELYNEELIDLLNLENKSLKLFEDPSSTSTVTVHGLTEITVYTSQEIFDIIAKSSQVRRTAETKLNRASRYSFFCIYS